MPQVLVLRTAIEQIPMTAALHLVPLSSMPWPGGDSVPLHIAYTRIKVCEFGFPFVSPVRFPVVSLFLFYFSALCGVRKFVIHW